MGQRVRGLDAEEVVLKQPRRPERHDASSQDAKKDGAEIPLQHERHEVEGACAEHGANAEFAHSLDNAVGHHAVESGGGQQQGEHREARGRDGVKATIRDRVCDESLESRHAEDRLKRIDGPHDGSNRGDEVGGPGRRADHEAHHLGGHLGSGNVVRGTGGVLDRGVPDVPDDADDLGRQDAARVQGQRAADRRLTGEHQASEPVGHHSHRARGGQVRLREQSTVEERDPQDPEVLRVHVPFVGYDPFAPVG